MTVQKLFEEIKKSFPETKSELIPFSKKSFMWSSPVTKNIYYNQQQIEKYDFSDKALKGALAHELSHQVDYNTKGFFTRLFFRFKYFRNTEFKKKTEREADRITVKNGFGIELIQLLKESEKKFERKRFLERIKPFHLTISEVKSLMRNKN